MQLIHCFNEEARERDEGMKGTKEVNKGVKDGDTKEIVSC
jgi:hypothetical protein